MYKKTLIFDKKKNVPKNIVIGWDMGQNAHKKFIHYMGIIFTLFECVFV